MSNTSKNNVKRTRFNARSSLLFPLQQLKHLGAGNRSLDIMARKEKEIGPPTSGKDSPTSTRYKKKRKRIYGTGADGDENSNKDLHTEAYLPTVKEIIHLDPVIEQWYADPYERPTASGPAQNIQRRDVLETALQNQGFSKLRSNILASWLMRCQGRLRDFEKSKRISRGGIATVRGRRRARQKKKAEAAAALAETRLNICEPPGSSVYASPALSSSPEKSRLSMDTSTSLRSGRGCNDKVAQSLARSGAGVILTDPIDATGNAGEVGVNLPGEDESDEDDIDPVLEQEEVEKLIQIFEPTLESFCTDTNVFTSSSEVLDVDDHHEDSLLLTPPKINQSRPCNNFKSESWQDNLYRSLQLRLKFWSIIYGDQLPTPQDEEDASSQKFTYFGIGGVQGESSGIGVALPQIRKSLRSQGHTRILIKTRVGVSVADLDEKRRRTVLAEDETFGLTQCGHDEKARIKKRNDTPVDIVTANVDKSATSNSSVIRKNQTVHTAAHLENATTDIISSLTEQNSQLEPEPGWMKMQYQRPFSHGYRETWREIADQRKNHDAVVNHHEATAAAAAAEDTADDITL